MDQLTKGAVVPSIVFDLVDALQTSNVNANDMRLSALAHSVAAQLLRISNCMQGKWDDAPIELRRHIDELELLLQSVLRAVTSHSKPSKFRAFLHLGSAEDREKEISRLEKRLIDIQRSVLVLLGLDNSIMANQLYDVASCQTAVGVEALVALREFHQLHPAHTHSRSEDHHVQIRRPHEPNVLNMAPMASGPKTKPKRASRVSLYSRNDICLLAQIDEWVVDNADDRRRVRVTSFRGKRRADGLEVFVKTFTTSTSDRLQELEELLETRKQIWEPALPQLIGGNSSTSNIPFQVYLAPSEGCEIFGDWAARTATSNVVETIFGLYDMRTSIKGLLKFEQENSLHCQLRLPLSVVQVHPYEGRPHFSLVYVSSIESRENCSFDYSKGVPVSDYETVNNPIHFLDDLNPDGFADSTTPNSLLAAAFCGGSDKWFEGTQSLETLVEQNFDSISSNQLSSVLLEAGWLGVIRSNEIIFWGRMGLGDIGYIAKENDFEVVGNVHALLASEAGELLEWVQTEGPMVSSSGRGCFSLDKEEENTEVLACAEKLYKCCAFQNPPWAFETHWELEYKDLDQKWGLKILQQHAAQIIEANHLTISPHELQLVTKIARTWTVEFDQDDASMAPALSSETMFQFEDDNNSRPTIYRYEEEGPILRVRNNGAPEICKRMFYSLHSDLDLLNDELWDKETGTDVRDGRKIIYWTESDISYLQLPEGIAYPLD